MLSQEESRRQLLSEGYAVLRNILPPGEILKAEEASARVLAPQRNPEYQEDYRSIGSLLDISPEPGFADLISWEPSLAALKGLGCRDPKYMHGMLFNKLPNTPPTFWHQDANYWNHPSCYEDSPLYLILIYYLVDTDEKNGCLRVIPGSHRKYHPLHEALAKSHTPELRKMADPAHPAFQTYPDEKSVPVGGGDLVVMDARLLHAAHANTSPAKRTAVSLWYIPDYESLPEEIQARFVLEGEEDCRQPFIPERWPAGAKSKILPLLPPVYRGSKKPLPRIYVPERQLR